MSRLCLCWCGSARTRKDRYHKPGTFPRADDVPAGSADWARPYNLLQCSIRYTTGMNAGAGGHGILPTTGTGTGIMFMILPDRYRYRSGAGAGTGTGTGAGARPVPGTSADHSPLWIPNCKCTMVVRPTSTEDTLSLALWHEAWHEGASSLVTRIAPRRLDSAGPGLVGRS